QAGPSFQLARALHRSRRYEAAAAQYLRVVALDPLHEKAFQALDQLTDRLMRRDDSGQTAIDAASQIAQQLLALDSPPPRLRDLALTLMATFRSRSDPESASRYWRQLTEANPRAIEPRLQLA